MRAPLLVGVSLLLAGCGASTSGTPQPPDASAPGATCGVVTLAQGQSIPDADLTCFTSALAAGRRTTLTVVEPTTEGDGISTVYTALLDRHVQVDVDASKDAFAGTGPRVTRQVCAGATAGGGRLVLSSCADLPTPDPAAT